MTHGKARLATGMPGDESHPVEGLYVCRKAFGLSRTSIGGGAVTLHRSTHSGSGGKTAEG